MRWLANAALPADALLRGFNRVAADLGVEPVPSLPAVLGDLAMVTEVPEVLGVRPPRWPPGARPGVAGTGRHPAAVHGSALRAARRAPARRGFRVSRPAGPVVYAAITSTSPHIIRSVVGSLAALDVRVLVAATVHDLADLGDERVMVAGILPSHRVMPRVDLAVTAGGQGSVQTAMAAGTPVLAIPLQPEQDLNVVLLERQRLASSPDATRTHPDSRPSRTTCSVTTATGSPPTVSSASTTRSTVPATPPTSSSRSLRPLPCRVQGVTTVLETRLAAISAVHFALAPGVVVGLIPWAMTGWDLQTPPSSSPALRVGAAMIAAAVAVLVRLFVRFVTDGLGTPAPVVPTRRLVVSGLYRHVRNPMYIAVVAAIVGKPSFSAGPVCLCTRRPSGSRLRPSSAGTRSPRFTQRFAASYDEYRGRARVVAASAPVDAARASTANRPAAGDGGRRCRSPRAVPP